MAAARDARLQRGQRSRSGVGWAGRKERSAAIQRITLDTEAGQLSAELARHGITADALPMAAIAQAGGAFYWLADEPDLYTDADLVQPQAG